MRRSQKGAEIEPDQIFLDSTNLPAFDQAQFEGRLEKPIPTRTVILVGVSFFLILCTMLGRTFVLEVEDGRSYAKRSEQNRLRHSLIFGERGVITDSQGTLLAWNVKDDAEPGFSKRRYTDMPGFAHLLGYLKYPSRDKAGFYYKVDFEGQNGVERYWNEYIAPENGLKIVETDAHGTLLSESVLRAPRNGKNITLTVDARLQKALFGYIAALAKERGFTGGAGALMDVNTGDLLTLVSFPEFSSQVMTDGADVAKIAGLLSDSATPFLNRSTFGLYTPGSVIKPIIAIGALEEDIITSEKTIVSAGALVLQNPYDPKRPSVFKDWKAHGAVDMRHAIAVSSDVYFYVVGGGFEDQRGLGIGNIEKYLRLFGFGFSPGDNDFFGTSGVIPNPEWKRANFNGDYWRVGNTYHTAIGQYGLQVTPLQVVRAVAAIANGGKLLEPRLLRDVTEESRYSIIPVKSSSLDVAREGMRLGVLEGTASGLSLPTVSVAGKTGTAELGTQKRYVHSWVVGFFPYEKPRYAFAILMERGPRDNTIGALYVMRQFLEWMGVHTPEYLKADGTT